MGPYEFSIIRLEWLRDRLLEIKLELQTQTMEFFSGKPMNADYPIPYATTETHLGCLLVAGTANGIVSIKMADADCKDNLVAQLQQEYGAVEQTLEEPLVGWLRDLADYLNGGPWPQLPTAACGTAFQQQVWRLLQNIPVGTTVTYGELAGKLGLAAGAARAVGRACATNPVALVVPCHRVVGRSGSLTGFRWGIERKRALLQLEEKSEDTQLKLL